MRYETLIITYIKSLVFVVVAKQEGEPGVTGTQVKKLFQQYLKRKAADKAFVEYLKRSRQAQN